MQGFCMILFFLKIDVITCGSNHFNITKIVIYFAVTYTRCIGKIGKANFARSIKKQFAGHVPPGPDFGT